MLLNRVPLALLVATVCVFGEGWSYAQGLLPTPTADYLAIPRYDPRFGVEELPVANNGARRRTTRTYSYSLAAPLPNAVDLSTQLPAPGRQMFFDCTAWAVARGTYTAQMAKARSRTPTDPIDNFSTRYLYSQLTTGPSTGTYIYHSSQPSAYGIISSQGCASEETTPYLSGAADWGLRPTLRGTGEAANYRLVTHFRCVTSDDIKMALHYGIPVVIATHTDNAFAGLSGTGTYRWNGVRGDFHAMCVVGYDDARSAFRVYNSWGSTWADGGMCWADYGDFSTMNGDQSTSGWCYEAHVFIADDGSATQGRHTLSRHFMFLPTGAILEGSTVIAPAGSRIAAEATDHWLYTVNSDKHVIGLGHGSNWHDLTSPALPTGLSDQHVSMIAAAHNYLYVLAETGQDVYGRIPSNLSATGSSYWQHIRVPPGESVIDIRYRDGAVFIASEDGDVFQRILPSGGTPGSWQRVN